MAVVKLCAQPKSARADVVGDVDRLLEDLFEAAEVGKSNLERDGELVGKKEVIGENDGRALAFDESSTGGFLIMELLRDGIDSFCCCVIFC
jgi:hypothetical protein